MNNASDEAYNSTTERRKQNAKKTSKHYNIVRTVMQITEKSYNVLWWSKNVRQYRFGSPHLWQGPGY